MSKTTKKKQVKKEPLIPESQMVQNRLWKQLTDAKLPPISSRYIARKMQAKGATRFIEIVQTMERTYALRLNNGQLYHVGLHVVDIPAAEIKLSDI